MNLGPAQLDYLANHITCERCQKKVDRVVRVDRLANRDVYLMRLECHGYGFDYEVDRVSILNLGFSEVIRHVKFPNHAGAQRVDKGDVRYHEQNESTYGITRSFCGVDVQAQGMQRQADNQQLTNAQTSFSQEAKQVSSLPAEQRREWKTPTKTRQQKKKVQKQKKVVAPLWSLSNLLKWMRIFG